MTTEQTSSEITISEKFQASVSEIEPIFSSFRLLYDVYRSTLDNLRKQSAGLPRSYVEAIKRHQELFESFQITVEKKQTDISDQLYGQGLVLLVGYSESLLKELFHDLFVQNVKKLKTDKEFTLRTKDLSQIKDDLQLGELIISRLEEDKNPAEKLNFQNMEALQGIFKAYFGILISDDTKIELHKFWQIRHIIIHSSSIIDKRFIENIKAAGIDASSYKIGAHIKVSKTDYDDCFGYAAVLFQELDSEIARLNLRYTQL